MSNGSSRDCARLPIPLEVCPCCGRGVKPSRAWTWVDGDELLRASPECPDFGTKHCEACPIHNWIRHGIGRCGLIWIGEVHYPTTEHFNREAELMGISRRLPAIPRDFVLGETYVLLAHRKAIASKPELGKEIEYTPGIFRIFKPERIEKVVTGKESDEQVEALLERGITPVVIERIEDKQEVLMDV